MSAHESETDTEQHPHPLDCPWCGCSESRVLETRRVDAKRNPEPLPVLRRRRICMNCRRRFATKETVEEKRLASTVWKVTTNGRRIVDPSCIPAGRHSGEWTDYEVVVEISGNRFVLHTRNDMRCESYPCVVTCDRNGIRVQSVTT